MSATDMSGSAPQTEVLAAWFGALPGSDPQAAFFDQGGNSLLAVQLIADIERRLGVMLPFAVLASPSGADAIVEWIRSLPA
jgi:acyl carrier protein